MAKLVTGDRLKQAVDAGSFLQNGDASSVEAVNYDFHMGSRVLKALYGQPKDIATIPEEDRWVDPGEAVFLLTRETLNLPANMTATLTPKRKLAHSGIMMLGGLAVDPCYRGHLLLGLYNFSSTRYPLRPGAKLIGAVFYELEAGEECVTQTAPEEVTDFPDDLVRLIANYKPVELKGLQDALADTQRQLENLRADLTSDKTWRDDFKHDLEEHNKQLGALIDGLKEEKEARKSEDAEIKRQLGSMSHMFFGMRIGTAAVAALLIAALGGAAGYFVPKWLEPKPAASTAKVISPAAAPALPSQQGTGSEKAQ